MCLLLFPLSSHLLSIPLHVLISALFLVPITSGLVINTRFLHVAPFDDLRVWKDTIEGRGLGKS